MKSIVSNATPLIYLAKVGRINLLRSIFGEVAIPEEVEVEVVDIGKQLGKRDAYIVENAISEGWIKVFRTSAIKIPIELDRGEIAVISLAKKLGIREVLVDEISARTAARLVGLTPRGAVYILLRSLKNGLITLEEFLDILSQLVEQGFRLKEEVYIEAIRKAREIAES